MPEAKVGIIGGSGLYRIEGLTGVKSVDVSTPFGEPSHAIILGNLEGVEVAFLPRHGEGHKIGPAEIPARANIYALKSLGVERIISVSAVGSLKEEIMPLDVVIPDQLIDWTRGRNSTFFSDGIVGHVSLAEPFCPVLSQLSFEASVKLGARAHKGGTYLVMEGPQFSTKAESRLYRMWDAHIIAMTALPEAKLAREAEICYTTIAFVTDYDCWHEAHESVTTEMILTNLRKGIDTVKGILRLLLPAIPDERGCPCACALQGAIATEAKHISEPKRKELELLIGRYLDGEEHAGQA
ncbi:MAG: S-methyl-5'-thioadenosine phosphorylase [Dehalococcoidia bacterium]|nr:S-methyl-5'-thioadenosine phosphorylase [Dehalococcoidia bacterium]